MVSNPKCDDFFDNCVYHERKSLKNLAFSTKGVFIMHFNIGSLQTIFDSLAYYLSELQRPPDVIAISKTKISKSALHLNINLHSYSFLHCNSKAKAGGLAFYINESLSFSRRNNIKVELPLVENMWIETKTNRRQLLLEQFKDT